MALNDVPQGAQRISDTQAPIRQNFKTYIEANFAVDHVGFNSGSDSGKHKAIHIVNNGAGNPVAGSTEFILYNRPSPLTTFQELFITRPGGATPTTPITATTSGTFNSSGSGGGEVITQTYTWTFWPSRILVYTVIVTNNTGTPLSNLPQTIPFPNGGGLPTFLAGTTPVITASWYDSSGALTTMNDALDIQLVTATDFRVSARSQPASGYGFMYTVIGRASIT